MSVSVRINKNGSNNLENGVAKMSLGSTGGGSAAAAGGVKGRFNPAPSSAAARPPPPRAGGARATPGRFSGAAAPAPEPAKPSFGGSAADRMAQFRAAAEAEKAKEEKKKLAAEKKKADAEKPKEEPKAEEEEEEEETTKKKSEPACKRKKQKAQRTMSISNIVMDWVQEMTKDYEGVEIRNFSTSWANGLAFCALIHRFHPDEFDFNELKPENRRYNFDLAFNTGQKVRKIPLLLDTNDLVRMKKPEPRSVQTYIQWIWSVYGPESGYGPSQEEIQNATCQ